MSAELLMAAISFLLLVATVSGFILKGIRESLDNLWKQHNSEQSKSSSFREEVKSDYLRKDDMAEHVGLRLDSINDRMERVEAQLEKLIMTRCG